MPLGSLPGLLMIVLGTSETRKLWVSHKKITLSVNAVFQYFEALDVLLGFMFAPLGPILGPIWPPKGSQIDPEINKNGSTN